jgi:nicotinamide-nucleotide amidase
VGSELLDPARRETNALYITGRLREIGIDVAARVTLADDADLLRSAFAQAWGRADVVVATGGLGPTEDDLTREAAASALGLRLARDEATVEWLRARFARYGRVMAPVNEKQADLIEGARLLRNPRGTAPGQWLEKDGRVLVLLPGPPPEMEPMFEEQVLPGLRARAGERVLRRRILKIAGGESDVEQMVAAHYKTFTNPRTTILGAAGQVELHLVAEAATAAQAEEHIEALARGLRDILGRRLFSEDGRELNEVVAALLAERGLRLALAESCTGGMLASRLTEVPGASAFLDRATVAYSNEAKVEVLGVSPEVLARHGAVSEEAARAMAEGARARARADVGVAVTGIAGPGGGTEDKPVGLVFIALSGSAGDLVRRFHFPGDRDRVRRQACQAALDLLRRGLLPA